MKRSTVLIIMIILVIVGIVLVQLFVLQPAMVEACPRPTPTPTQPTGVCDPCDPSNWGLPGCEQWMCQKDDTSLRFFLFLPVTQR